MLADSLPARPSVVESRAFSVAGERGEDLLWVSRFAQYGDRVWSELYGAVDIRAPAVWVSLERALMEVPRRIQIEQSGRVRVDLRWDETLSRYDLASALAEGWLRRAGRFAGAGENPPRWLVAASADWLLLALNPLHLDIRSSAFDPSGRWKLSEILSFESMFSEKDSVYPFLLFRGLFPGLSDREPARLHQLLLGPIGVRDVIGAVVPPGVDPELWWATVAVAQIAEPRGAYWNMIESRHRIERLSTMELLYRGAESVVDLRGLRAIMNHDEIRIFADRRAAVVRRDLGRIHPVYYNALLALGQTLEAISQRDGGLATSLESQFRRDWEAALRSHEEIERALATR